MLRVVKINQVQSFDATLSGDPTHHTLIKTTQKQKVFQLRPEK
jgi:hypothetical protein